MTLSTTAVLTVDELADRFGDFKSNVIHSWKTYSDLTPDEKRFMCSVSSISRSARFGCFTGNGNCGMSALSFCIRNDLIYESNMRVYFANAAVKYFFLLHFLSI